MLYRTILPALAAVFIIATCASAENLVRIEYKTPTTANQARIKAAIESSPGIGEVVTMINELFLLKKPIPIIFGGSDGPLFDSGSNEIIIPYSFVDEIRMRFKKDNYQETGVSIEAATMDALMHTLFHEIGHALVNMFSIPVLGRHEDAVDALATILLIEFFEGGQEIVISAADLFDLESRDTEEFEEEDSWDEHSLDVQRYYITLCHVYGSAPDRYKHLPGDLNFSNDKADQCIDDYQILVDDWLRLLEPFMKKASVRSESFKPIAG